MEFLVILPAILLVFFGLYLLLLMPGKPNRADCMKSVMYAHRGYHDISLGIPENSLSAFRRAKSYGYGVELDIQLTKDGKLIVFHDESLKRLCGVDLKVRDCTYEQLLQYRLLDTKEQIPLFSDVLELLGKETPILCEIKVYGGYQNGIVCKTALPLLKAHRDHLVVESFHPFVLIDLRKLAPEIVRGQLSCIFSKNKNRPNAFVGFMVQHLLLNLFARPDFIAYRHTDLACISLRISRKLYAVPTVAWTVTSATDQRDALDAGCVSVIFEGYQPTS